MSNVPEQINIKIQKVVHLIINVLDAHASNDINMATKDTIGSIYIVTPQVMNTNTQKLSTILIWRHGQDLHLHKTVLQTAAYLFDHHATKFLETFELELL
jgi:hypothetical protein